MESPLGHPPTRHTPAWLQSVVSQRSRGYLKKSTEMQLSMIISETTWIYFNSSTVYDNLREFTWTKSICGDLPIDVEGFHHL